MKLNLEARKPGNGSGGALVPSAGDGVPRSRTLKLARRRLARAIRLSDRIGKLAKQKREALEGAVTAGLNLYQPVEIDGEKWELVKPQGRYVYFPDLELHKLAKNPRHQARPDPTEGGAE